MFDEGRFGPVYRSHDQETSQPVLVRTFAQPLGPDEQVRLVDALTRLCETPLDHPSIAQPLMAGIDEGRPFLVHTLLPGVSLQRFLAEYGPQPLPDVALRVTQLAAAIDFAAAAGVHHGDLGARDVIVSPEGTGISGLGVIQALNEAGIAVAGPTPSRADDVRALARMTFELLQGRVPSGVEAVRSLTVAGADAGRLRRAFAAALSENPQERPATALEFAETLQEALAIPDETGAPVDAPDTAGARDMTDLPLRQDDTPHRFALDDGPVLSLAAASQAVDEGPSLREAPAMSVPAPAIRAERPTAAPMFAAVAPRGADREQSGRGTGWFVVAAALAIGIFSGFASGFVVGQRGDPLPVPRFAADVIRPAPALPPQAAPTAGIETPDSGSANPGAASGIGDSRSAIPDPEIKSRELPSVDAVSEPESTPPAPDATEPATPAPPVASTAPGANREPARANPEEQRTAKPEPRSAGPASRGVDPGFRAPAGTPGGLHVLSRPDGAQVYVDGALVGQTPIVIPTVRPGIHDVRIELAGHRRWATPVRVEPGERARVAASLEQ